MSSYYDILGVPKNASDDDIKRAYRKLALKHHPDKSGGDDTKFQEIQMAYETLSDPERKSRYDNPNVFPEHTTHGFPFEFFFGQQPGFPFQFAGNTQTKRSDHFYTCNVQLKDIFFGTTKRFKIKRDTLCVECHDTCSKCNGYGIRRIHPHITQTCDICSGRGRIVKGNCNICKNKRSITEEKLVEIVIHKGMPSGEKFIFEHWGEQPSKNGEIAGNLYVTVQVEEHPQFKRDNLDLIFYSDITLAQTIIGCMIDIPLFDEPLSLNTRGFGIINPNKQYTVYNRGLVDEHDKKGNLHIRFRVTYPEKVLSDDHRHILSLAFDQVGI